VPEPGAPDARGGATPAAADRQAGARVPSSDEIFQAIRNAGSSNAAKTRAVERMLRKDTGGGAG